jgi:CheY-like chemotaxis protein
MSETKGLTIVTADDDDMNLYILLKNIKDGGHTGIGFEEGDVTWDYLEAHPDEVDIVLLDKMMKTLDGLEIIRRMKAHPVLKNVPVILQSGDAVTHKINEALALGADGYLVKPYNSQQLYNLISEVMEKQCTAI